MLIDHLKVQVKLNIFINYVNDNYIKYEEVGEDQLESFDLNGYVIFDYIVNY